MYTGPKLHEISYMSCLYQHMTFPHVSYIHILLLLSGMQLRIARVAWNFMQTNEMCRKSFPSILQISYNIFMYKIEKN